MKTVIITSFHPMISRNVLSTGLLEMLTKGTDTRVVITVPQHKIAYFTNLYGSERVVVEGCVVLQASKTRTGLFFKKLAIYSNDTQSSRNLRRYAYHLRGNLPLYLSSTIFALLSHVPGFGRLYRYCDARFSPKGFFVDLLERYQPDCVVSTDIQNENDVSLLHDARDRGVRILGMVRSWDNLTLRIIRVIPDLLIVPSSEVAYEAEHIHRIPSKQILVVGNLHYDRYIKGPTISRADFFSHYGLDPDLPLILYAPVSDVLIRDNDIDRYVLEELSRFHGRASVLVRFPPEKAVSIGDFFPPSSMKFDMPGVTFSDKEMGDREISRADDDSLLNSLYYADVVVTGPTSLLLDAAFFDKPAIAVDLYPSKRGVWDSVWRFNDVHIQKLLSTGSATRVRDIVSFHRAVTHALRFPQVGRAARRTVRQRWFSRVDGLSVERLQQAISAEL